MEPEREEGKKGLKGLLGEVVNKLHQRLEEIYGPAREMSVPQEEIDKLVKQAQIENLSPTELAHRVYALKQKYPTAELPEEFKKFLDKEE